MEVKDLIGFQLVEINNNFITVAKDNEKYVIKINEDEGDCCGFNEIETKLFYEKSNTRNPVITNIAKEQNNIDESGYWDGDSATITFFGEHGKLAELNSISSSGSGWGYGATVKLNCEILNIDEVVTHW